MSTNPITFSAQVVKNYNYFFHPSVCHVCKLATNLRKCSSCYMISYCSENHMLLHRPQHIEICNAILKIKHNILDSTNMTLNRWIIFKLDYLRRIKEEVRRRLQPYEEQMFLYPESCWSCYCRTSLTEICKECYFAQCSSHVLLYHEDICMFLKNCFYLDKQYAIHDIEKNRIPKKFMSVSLDEYYNIKLFVMSLIQCDLNKWDINEYSYTDAFSRPLTLFHGFQRRNLSHYLETKGNFVVHIITGYFTDTFSLSAWEILLHQLKKNTNLIIVMIGPEAQDISRTYNPPKSLQYECIRMLYYDYASSTLYKKPNVIIGFNAQLCMDTTTTEIIKALQSQHCPLLLTAVSQSKARKNTNVIENVLGKSLTPIFSGINKFRSYRPYRAYESTYIFFPNNHLTIYSNLIDDTKVTT